MGEIKSAFEKAMEKIANLEKASPEELRRMEYVPKGGALAAKYLQEEGYDLRGELNKYETNLRKYLLEGAEETFLRNIALPQDKYARQRIKKAMEGIVVLKGNRKRLEGIFEKMEHLFNYYEQTSQQAYEQLRGNFEMQMREAKRQLEQQTGRKVEIRPEQQPQFQEEWRRTLAAINAQYEKVLEEQKQEIKGIR
jgi:hypothetical protein